MKVSVQANSEVSLLGSFFFFNQIEGLSRCIMFLPENSFTFGEFGKGCIFTEFYIGYLFLRLP